MRTLLVLGVVVCLGYCTLAVAQQNYGIYNRNGQFNGRYSIQRDGSIQHYNRYGQYQGRYAPSNNRNYNYWHKFDRGGRYQGRSGFPYF